jgi:hypothetical protein
MKNSKRNRMSLQTRERITEWHKKGMPIKVIAKGMSLPYSNVYNHVKKLESVMDEQAYKEAAKAELLENAVLITEELVDLPVKVNFQMKIYGISIKVTRIPSEVIFDEDYLEIN